MSLKSRLQRMGTAPRTGAGGPEAPPAVPVEDGLARAGQLLHDALGLAAPDAEPVASASAPGPGPAPFQPYETPLGPVARRLWRVDDPEERARLRVELLVSADARVLSLLALEPRLASVELARTVFFDTETTGLGGAGSLAFLVGLAWFDGPQVMVEQLLLEGPEQEPALLYRVAELFAQAELLVSFNGKSFDLPLLLGRCVMNRLEPLPARPHLDLLHVSRRVHQRRLSSSRLSTLEAEVLGFQRPKEDIAGADIPPRFAHYLRTRDFSAIEPVVLHNEWDVLSMVSLLGLYAQPLQPLEDRDLLGVADTYRRSRELGGALEVVERVMERSASPEALALRARLYKAQGERAQALADFERLARQVPDPGVRLELAKLYEHYAQDFQAALGWVAQGTSEEQVPAQKRRERLERKLARARERGS